MEYWKKEEVTKLCGAREEEGRVILVIVELFCNGPNFLSIPLLFNLHVRDVIEQEKVV